jgi:hypothetical protein
MVSRNYFIKQAGQLLRLARIVKDPKLAAGLLAKAADLEERSIEAKQEPPLIVPALKDQPET